MSQPLKCGFCDYEFDPDTAPTVCAACPLAKGCHLVCCPRCGYQMPPEAKLIGWIRTWRRQLSPSTLVEKM